MSWLSFRRRTRGGATLAAGARPSPPRGAGQQVREAPSAFCLFSGKWKRLLWWVEISAPTDILQKLIGMMWLLEKQGKAGMFPKGIGNRSLFIDYVFIFEGTAFDVWHPWHCMYFCEVCHISVYISVHTNVLSWTYFCGFLSFIFKRFIYLLEREWGEAEGEGPQPTSHWARSPTRALISWPWDHWATRLPLCVASRKTKKQLLSSLWKKVYKVFWVTVFQVHCFLLLYDIPNMRALRARGWPQTPWLDSPHVLPKCPHLDGHLDGHLKCPHLDGHLHGHLDSRSSPQPQITRWVSPCGVWCETVSGIFVQEPGCWALKYWLNLSRSCQIIPECFPQFSLLIHSELARI